MCCAEPSQATERLKGVVIDERGLGRSSDASARDPGPLVRPATPPDLGVSRQTLNMVEHRPTETGIGNRQIGLEQFGRALRPQQLKPRVVLDGAAQSAGQDRYAAVERFGERDQPGKPDAILAALVLLHLLEGHADALGQALLTEAQTAAPRANSDPQLDVQAMGGLKTTQREAPAPRIAVPATKLVNSSSR